MDPICLIAGPIISFVTSAVKKIPWIGANPKKFAGILATITGVATGLMVGHPSGPTVQHIVQCILTNFGLSVATYETVTKAVGGAVQGN